MISASLDEIFEISTKRLLRFWHHTVHNYDGFLMTQKKTIQISEGQNKTKQNRKNKAEQGKGQAVQSSAFDG